MTRQALLSAARVEAAAVLSVLFAASCGPEDQPPPGADPTGADPAPTTDNAGPSTMPSTRAPFAIEMSPATDGDSLQRVARPGPRTTGEGSGCEPRRGLQQPSFVQTSERRPVLVPACREELPGTRPLPSGSSAPSPAPEPASAAPVAPAGR